MENVIQPAPAPSPVQVALAAAQRTLAALEARMAEERKPKQFVQYVQLATTLVCRISVLSKQVAVELEQARVAEREAQQRAEYASRAKPAPVQYARWPRCTRYQRGHKWRKDGICSGCRYQRVEITQDSETEQPSGGA